MTLFPQLQPASQLEGALADFKNGTGKRGSARKATLQDAAHKHIAMLSNNPQRAMSYFRDPHVRSAA
jgi:hypothetical protein